MISYPMTPQYVKAGPASKLASQIRHVTLNPSVLESINSFLHALLSAIVCEIATSQANSRKEDLLHPHTSSPGCRAAEESRIQERIKYPVTTDSFKKASLSICGKNNILVREAILEAEVIQNEWIRAKGKELDPALIVGETEEEVGKKDFLDVPSPFNRRKYSRSTSTLQSISDAGEDEDEEQIDGPRIGPRAAASPERLPHSALTHSSPAPKFIGVQEYMIEVQKALEHLSPLSSNTNLFNTFESRSRAASSQSPLYTTPLLVLYMSAFLHVIASEIIEGTGDIVVMKTTASEATMEDMKELMMGDDHLRFLWCKLVSLILPLNK